MIFGYIKYRPRNLVVQIISSMKLVLTMKKERMSDVDGHVEFRPVPEINSAHDCIKCDLCITHCPTEALSYTKNEDVLIKIDRELCRPCKLCVEVCPTEYFSYRKSSHSQVLFGKRIEKFLAD